MALRKRTDLIVVHTSATYPHQDFGAAEINRMHKARGWSGTGYASVVRQSGKRELGRGYDQVGAHVEGWNSVSVGIVYIGGLDASGRPANTLNRAQEQGLVAELKHMLTLYPKAKICGHRDLSPDRDGDGIIEPHEHVKACPCFDAIPWARALGLPAADIRGVWDGAARPVAPVAPDERSVYLQRLLARAGYAFGPIDGIIGKRTREALRQYQTWAGLKVTGDFDAATVATLRARFEKVAA